MAIVLPVTPPDRIHAAGLDTKNEVFADSVGWSDVADQVTATYAHLSALEGNTVIISAYYGVPGAIQVYGKAKVLPAVVSPQLSDFYWLPDNLTASNALMVDYQPVEVAWMSTATVGGAPHRPLRSDKSGARSSGHLLPARGSDPRNLGQASQLFLIAWSARARRAHGGLSGAPTADRLTG